MTRPKTIVAFELIFFAVLTLGVLKIWWNWEDFLPNNVPLGIGLSVLIVRLLILGGLVLLVSRRRKKIGVWVLILLTLGPILSHILLFLKVSSIATTTDLMWMIVLESGVEIFAIALLFTPSSQKWLAHNQDTTELAETFS